jgi:hypothetical protein
MITRILAMMPEPAKAVVLAAACAPLALRFNLLVVLRLGLHGLRRRKARLFHEAASAVNLRAQVGINVVARQFGSASRRGSSLKSTSMARRLALQISCAACWCVSSM